MISPSWGLPPRRRQRSGESRLFSRIRRSTRLRATRMSRQTRSLSPDLAVALALPGRCLQVGFDRHQQRLVRDRGLRSPTLCRLLLGVLAGGHGVERGAGHAPGIRRRPAAGRRPDPCRARWRHSSPRPPPPQRAEGLRLGLQQFHLFMVNSPIRFMALSSSACTGSPLRSLSEASIPPIAFSRHCSSRKISTPNWRDRSCTGSSRKSRMNDLTLARHRPSLAKSQRACRQSLAWGKRGRAKLARIYHRPINSNFLRQNYRSFVPVLLGHFD